MQPARCLGWKFSTEEASVVCMVVIYLNCIFLFNRVFPPSFLLSGVVYFSPKVGGAEREGFASIPTIHQWLTELMKLKLTAA